MERVKNTSLLLVIAISVNLLAYLIKSDFIGPFLKNNIVAVLINILAVNIATCAILMTKLNEINAKNEVDFTATYKELKISLKEQVSLIALSFIVLIFDKSSVLNNYVPYCSICINILLTAIFIYAIDVLWDIGKAVFTIIHH